MRRILFLAFMLAGTLVLAQQDPWWHPINPYGTSMGVGYGTVFPGLASTGSRPGNGELFVQDLGAALPVLWIYDQSTTTWSRVGPFAFPLTVDTIVANDDVGLSWGAGSDLDITWYNAAGVGAVRVNDTANAELQLLAREEVKLQAGVNVGFVDQTRLWISQDPGASTTGNHAMLRLRTETAIDAGDERFWLNILSDGAPAHTGGIVNGVFVGATTANAATTYAFRNGAVGWDYGLYTQATYALQHPGILFAALGAPPNGTIAYCTDCTITNPCAGGGTGAFAKRINGTWICN